MELSSKLKILLESRIIQGPYTAGTIVKFGPQIGEDADRIRNPYSRFRLHNACK